MKQQTFLVNPQLQQPRKYRWRLLPLLLLSATAAIAAPPPSTEDVISALGISADQVARLDQGEIITNEIGEATQKELAMGVAMYLPSPPSKLAAYVRKGELSSIDPDIKATAGIAPYARDGGKADPAAELRIAATSSKVLARFFPEMQKAWLNYPAKLPSGTEERFYWLNRTVENRPTAILGHRILQASDAGALILVRQFYVGHSYNSSQLAIGCLPYRDGSILFYAQRTSTDQVAGFGSSLRHNIGRDQMKEQMINRLERLRSALQSF